MKGFPVGLGLLFTCTLLLVCNSHAAVVGSKTASTNTSGVIQGGKPSQCNISPDLWCDDADIRSLCGTTTACSAWQSRPAPKVSLVYEIMCPYCQRFLTEVLYTKLWRNLAQIVDIELIPYGNARETQLSNGTWSFRCQHGYNDGEPECRGNILHNCVIAYNPDISVYFPFINCMETILIECSTSCSVAQVDAAMESCFRTERISTQMQQTLIACRDGAEGNKLMHEAGLRTEQVWPEQHQYSPWILIDGVSTAKLQRFQQVIDQFVCWNSPKASSVEYCNTVSMRASLKAEVWSKESNREQMFNLYNYGSLEEQYKRSHDYKQ